MAAPAATLITRVTGTNAAAATFNGATQDNRTTFTVRFFGSITNGGTAPTVAAQANLQVSQDNFATDVNTVATVTASLTNSATTTFDFFRYLPGSYTRVQITGNTVQGVTYIISGNAVTAIS